MTEETARMARGPDFCCACFDPVGATCPAGSPVGHSSGPTREKPAQLTGPSPEPGLDCWVERLAVRQDGPCVRGRLFQPPAGRVASLLFTAAVLLLLSGCGFHLRGAVDIPAELEPVYIQSGGLVGKAIDERLRGSGVPVTGLANEAGMILRIRGQSRSSRVVAVDRAGKALAYALEFQVGFDAVDASGRALIPEQRITLERTFDDNPDVAVLGKQLESDIIYQDMADDAADQVLLRLRAAVMGRSRPAPQVRAQGVQ